MKQVRPWLCVLVVAAFLPGTATNSFACSCSRYSGGNSMRDEAALRRTRGPATEVIFEGTVEAQRAAYGSIGAPQGVQSMTSAGEHRIANVQVSRTYKGHAEGVVSVLTGMGTGDCGFDFQTGQAYLIYAEPVGKDEFFTSICSPTALVAETGPALRYLRGEPPESDDLLAPETYLRKYWEKSSGSVCGRVTAADGQPLEGAVVEMSPLRREPLPFRTFPTYDDPNNSKSDGSFCVRGMPEGEYLLSAWLADYKTGVTWRGFYPATTMHSEAVPIQVKAGETISGVQLGVHKLGMFSVKIHVAGPAASAFPWQDLWANIDSPEQDRLALHTGRPLDASGSCSWTHSIPAGRYLISTVVGPDRQSGLVPKELSKWKMAKQEIDVTADTTVDLNLIPVE